MQAVRIPGAIGRGFVMAGVLVLAAAGPGFAYTGPSRTTNGGGSGDGTLTAGVQYQYTKKPSSGSATVPLGSSDVTWTPPPCWIGPVGDPETFKKKLLQSVKDTNVPGQANYALEAMAELQQHYEDGKTWDGAGDGYKNFNLDKQGKGQFWGPVMNPDSDSPDRFNCNSTLPFWVDNGKLPPPGTPEVITPEMLSRLAYARTQVPGVTVVTSPAQTQTVNLPTWVHLTDDYSDVSVRASIDLGGGQEIWAETTAHATQVHIDPGESDATLFPASGNCPVKADGSVGAAYSGNAQADPPCGMTYRRANAGGSPYTLDVTVRWDVSWQGSGGTGGTLPQAVVHNDPPQQVTVREIQSVNR